MLLDMLCCHRIKIQDTLLHPFASPCCFPHHATGFAKFGIYRIEILDTQGVLGPGPGVPAGALPWAAALVAHIG